MKKGIWIAAVCLIAALSIGISGCGLRVLRSITARNEASADTVSEDTARHPAGKGESGSAGETGRTDTGSTGTAAGVRTETVWRGIYALDGDPGSEIFAVLSADAQTVTGWYLYETAAGGFGMHSFTWDISAGDSFTATGPFGNGSDAIDTYRLQSDRITVEYPDGWWDDRDYMYLCAVEDAGAYVTNPAFDPSLLTGGTSGDAGTSGNAGSSGDAGTSGTDAAASQPFYGIWVLGSHDLSECRDMVSRLQGQGFTGAAVFYTTDWSNLNTEPWYVVTTGCYANEDQANAALPSVQAAGYADAYVKYSGERQAFDFAG